MTRRGSVVVVPGVVAVPAVAVVLAVVALLALAAPARAIDLNGYRAQHGRPPLQYSAELAAAAQAHAYDLARRGRLDHRGWRARLGGGATTAAENVSYGCNSVDCAIRQWARSPGHRRNMLMGGVSRYGLASAADTRGRRYWVLELGN
jgi:uncharacterized protein YkwD